VTVAIDPVGSGIVASLAHPGGSVTGLATSSDDTVPKQLQLLAKMAGPRLSRLGLLFNPSNVGSPTVLKLAQDSASIAGLRLVPAYLRNAQDRSHGTSASGLRVSPL
jgi:putative ABC transport system substrate-binding protein